MNNLCRIVLSAAVMLVTARLAVAQEKKPPDYSAKTVVQWIEALKNPQNLDLVGEAHVALGPDGPYANKAIPALIDALDDNDYGPDVLPALLGALNRSEPMIRAGAAAALEGVSPKPKSAVDPLLIALNDKASEVRAAAAQSLGRIGRSSDKTVLALATALEDKDEEVREAAAWSLSVMQRKAEPAVPALISALKDKNVHVRHRASWALTRIGPAAKAAVPSLIEAIQNKDDRGNRAGAARALAAIGPAAKSAVPALIASLKNPDDEEFLECAIAALGGIGPGAKDAIPELLKLAKDKKERQRYEAMQALGRIGPAAKAAVPVLLEALDDPKYGGSIQVTAAEALGSMGSEAKAALPQLVALAHDLGGHDLVRKAAAKAVKRIDPELWAKENLEFAHLNIRLGKLADVKLPPCAAATEAQKKRIKALIAKLADIDSPDFGMSAELTGEAFAPVPNQERWHGGVLPANRGKTSEAFRSLVELGPMALPFLLDALHDKTPTKLRVNPSFGGTCFGNELTANPLNSLESRIVSMPAAPEGDETDGFLTRPYTVAVGDVCLVAIGQIVGRPYRAVRYVPSLIIVINSPVESKQLRDQVRALWSSDDPAKKLVDSLLLDYATEGLFNDRSFPGENEATDFQCQAALRMLYYFPKETALLIAPRLRSFDVKEAKDDAWLKREVKNGVRAADFIKAVSWCQEDVIQEALADLAKRTDDPHIKEALPTGNK